jgi:hypothetical protein
MIVMLKGLATLGHLMKFITVHITQPQRANKVKDNLRSGITNSSYKTVSFKPLFGILNQPKFIPLQWLPLTMEFELVTDALDPIIPLQRCEQSIHSGHD